MPTSRWIAPLVAAAFTTGLAAAEPRAARSVHLQYPAPDAVVFMTGMTVVESTPGSYFMATGWDTGYFGVQELGGGKKVVIFSVWDPTRGDDPAAVKEEDRVECLHAADGMRVKRFGGEGTGGQCLGDLDWKLGEPLQFAVRARPEGEKTAYEGHLLVPGADAWRHLVTFRTRTGGRPLRGLYSFVEDFRRDGRSVRDVRRARFHHGWVRDMGGAWQPLVKAQFTASSAPWEAKESIDAGVEGRFFTLATGGDIRESRPLGSFVELPASDAPAPESAPF